MNKWQQSEADCALPKYDVWNVPETESHADILLGIVTFRSSALSRPVSWHVSVSWVWDERLVSSLHVPSIVSVSRILDKRLVLTCVTNCVGLGTLGWMSRLEQLSRLGLGTSTSREDPCSCKYCSMHKHSQTFNANSAMSMWVWTTMCITSSINSIISRQRYTAAQTQSKANPR